MATEPKLIKQEKGATRYFDKSIADGELEHVDIKPKTQQNFEGEVIKINQKQQKPLSKHLRQNKKLKPHKFLKKSSKLAKEIIDKHSRGEKVDSKGVKTNYFKEKQQRKEVYLEYATEQAARTELLLTEQEGFIEPGAEEITAEYRQEEIVKNVDILSASKNFNLQLEFGPYKMRYTKNGRHLLLGGRRGHVAAFDWVTKKLNCEINVMEEIVDVAWLHVNTMFACAQKSWTYIYDNKGIELHCVKRLYNVNRLEFLPYHFLLAAGSSEGYLSWLDVSIGELVGNFNTRLGDIRLMCQNPYNGVLCVGGGKGVVTMWSPKVRKPLAKILSHTTPMSALTIDPKGMYMITAGQERQIKIWDVRQLSGPLCAYKLRLPANQIAVSQRGILAFTQGNYCEMYSNLLVGQQAKTPYLRHPCDSIVNSMQFCPYEDILGVTTTNGFQSLLVPGSGEPNFDALEDNPFQTARQRREREVHALLEKIPPELITLDPNDVSNVDVPTLQEKVEGKRALFYLKPPKIDFKTRRKMKGRGGSANAAKNKQIVKDQKRKEFIADLRAAKKEVIDAHREPQEAKDFLPLENDTKLSVLDRFRPNKKKT